MVRIAHFAILIMCAYLTATSNIILPGTRLAQLAQHLKNVRPKRAFVVISVTKKNKYAVIFAKNLFFFFFKLLALINSV